MFGYRAENCEDTDETVKGGTEHYSSWLSSGAEIQSVALNLRDSKKCQSQLSAQRDSGGKTALAVGVAGNFCILAL